LANRSSNRVVASPGGRLGANICVLFDNFGLSRNNSPSRTSPGLNAAGCGGARQSGIIFYSRTFSFRLTTKIKIEFGFLPNLISPQLSNHKSAIKKNAV
jgi:hypothetical protein